MAIRSRHKSFAGRHLFALGVIFLLFFVSMLLYQYSSTDGTPRRAYLHAALLLALLFFVFLYHTAARISRHIGHLRRFARQAEQGRQVDFRLERRLPDDDLGDISHTIIQLYWNLHHARAEQTRIKRQLTQNVAHELKTPAASIHGFLQTILENPGISAEQRQHFLERCYAQSQRMSSLLQDMDALTKLDTTLPCTPADEAEVRQVDVAHIIHAALEDAALSLHARHITPVVDIPQNIIVPGSAQLIYSIVRNLVDNAVNYATGATRLSIQCRRVEQDGKHHYSFRFADNGIGVSASHLPHLFERFYRVDTGRTRRQGGTGLGLAIVKNAVLRHGGTVHAETTPGGGLTIIFTLAQF